MQVCFHCFCSAVLVIVVSMVMGRGVPFSAQDRLTAALCSGDVPYRRWFLAALASPFSVCPQSWHRNRAWVLRFSGLQCPHSGHKSDEFLAGVSMYFAPWRSHAALNSARCSPGATFASLRLMLRCTSTSSPCFSWVPRSRPAPIVGERSMRVLAFGVFPGRYAVLFHRVLGRRSRGSVPAGGSVPVPRFGPGPEVRSRPEVQRWCPGALAGDSEMVPGGCGTKDSEMVPRGAGRRFRDGAPGVRNEGFRDGAPGHWPEIQRWCPGGAERRIQRWCPGALDADSEMVPRGG